MGLSWIDFKRRPGAMCAREFICWSFLMTAEILIISCLEFFVSSQWFAFSVLCFICAISPKSDGRRRLSAQGCSRQQASKQAACSRVPPALMLPGKRCDLSSGPHSWLLHGFSQRWGPTAATGNRCSLFKAHKKLPTSGLTPFKYSTESVPGEKAMCCWTGGRWWQPHPATETLKISLVWLIWCSCLRE